MEFDELLERAGTLIDLARSEGFIAFAEQLRNFRNAVARNRGAFETRVAPRKGKVVTAADVGELLPPPDHEHKP